MLNTFFFGYLPLKWKRLARVLSIVITIAGIVIFDTVFLIPIIIVAIISYTLKPFIVK